MISRCTKCGNEMIVVDKIFKGIPFYIIKCISCNSEKTVQAFSFDDEKQSRCS